MTVAQRARQVAAYRKKVAGERRCFECQGEWHELCDGTVGDYGNPCECSFCEAHPALSGSANIPYDGGGSGDG